LEFRRELLPPDTCLVSQHFSAGGKVITLGE
jgi:hypothetical protein